jgi:hypothetical protein
MIVIPASSGTLADSGSAPRNTAPAPATAQAANPPTVQSPAGQSPAPEATQPTVLTFDPPSVEFGAMFVGKTRHATVKVTNTSDGPVTISRTIPGCLCTKSSDPPKDPLAPGASFTIDVSLDGGDYGGTKLRKVVNFLIDGRPTEFLWLHGEVQKVIGVTPQVLDVRKATDGETLKVRLESARFMDFTVRGVEPAGIVTCGTEPSTEHELSIDVSALRAAGMPTKLTVRTDHPDADEIFVLLRVPPPPPTPQDSAPTPPQAPASPPSRG